ncbi:hypothetical protein [Christiangramia echinicola]|uniref:hypothetical protein n=1 Tax=Christiangramia echinicola TaxID=279359 RepID=UPI00047A99EF|nr:hypothetical protein [Christiangramia echinicola]
MQLVKTDLFFIFPFLFLSKAQAQDINEWSSWKTDEEVRYKKIDKEEDRFFYEIECRNRFPHNLSYVLVIDPLVEKANYIRLSQRQNEIIPIKPEKSIYPEALEIYSFYTSLTPSWPVNLSR